MFIDAHFTRTDVGFNGSRYCAFDALPILAWQRSLGFVFERKQFYGMGGAFV
jgi:hypothetical protein